MANGAYFLGDLTKFVHVSPQRFASVLLQGNGPCGLTVRVVGSSGESVTVAAVDPAGLVHLSHASIPSGGFVDVTL